MDSFGDPGPSEELVLGGSQEGPGMVEIQKRWKKNAVLARPRPV